MSESPSELSSQLSDLFLKRARRFRDASIFVKFMLLAVASGVVSAMQFLQIPKGEALSVVQAIGIGASILVVFGALFTMWTEDDASEELGLAKKSIEAARETQQSLEQAWVLEIYIERAIQLYQSSMVLRGVVERAALSGVSLDSVLSSFMDATQRSLPIAMGFDTADVWTLCVFRAEPEPGEKRDHLRCVAHNRAIQCPMTEARTWPEGVGVAGISYANGSEIVVPDLQSFNLGSMFNLAAGARSYDDDRYRSIVSVPVRVDGKVKPWGVVVATSDRVDHFNLTDAAGPKTTEPVRLLSAMVALAVVMCDEKPTAAAGGKGGNASPAAAE